MTKPPVFLLAYANYHEGERGYLRNLPEERRRVVEKLSRAQRAGICEVIVLNDVTLEEIIKVFQDEVYKGRIALFHFSGHANGYALHLENPFRNKESLFMESFAEFLGMQQSLQVVFLNGCSTASQGEMLIREGIPGVIFTHTDISDTVACLFATYFYEALGAGSAIGQAFQEAAVLVRSQEQFQDYRALYRQESQSGKMALPWDIQYHPEKTDSSTWNLPDAADQPLYILPALSEGPLPNSPFPGLIPYSNIDRPVFWGRDAEIRHFYQSATASTAPQILIIYGARGVGKTSFLQAGLLPYLELDHKVIHWQCAVDKAMPPIPQNHAKQPIFLILDAPSPTSLTQVTTQLYKSLSVEPNLKILLLLPTDEVESWEEAFHQLQLFFKAFYLPPLGLKAIQQIIKGGTKNQIVKAYGAVMDEELPERLAHFLSKDESSCVGPLLQYSMQRLWEKAREKSREHPTLSWDLFQDMNRSGMWRGFIEQQLSELPLKYNDSGLLLNLLGECLPEDNTSKIVLASYIKEKYVIEEALKEDLFQQFLNIRLLCTPALDNLQLRRTLRLSHQLLERPLLHLLHQSQRPGQEIPRLLQHHLKRASYLNKMELALVQRYRDTIPKLNIKEEQLLKESVGVVNAERKRLRNIQIWSSISILFILSAGYLFFNPYILLYGLLLYLAYLWAKAL